MEMAVRDTTAPGADQNVRERNLIAIVGELARELHPQHARPDTISLSSRLERDLGIDSLGRTELVLRLERAFGVRLSINLVGEANSVGDLWQALEQAGQTGAAIAAAPAPPSLGAVSAAAEASTLHGGSGVARCPQSRPPSPGGAGGQLHDHWHSELRRACKTIARHRSRAGRARHCARRSGGAHAAHGPRFFHDLFRRALCRWHPGADLSAHATLPDRGLCAPPSRDPP